MPRTDSKSAAPMGCLLLLSPVRFEIDVEIGNSHYIFNVAHWQYAAALPFLVIPGIDVPAAAVSYRAMDQMRIHLA